MNARSNLITVLLALSLIGPTAAGASVRNIPWDAPLHQSSQAASNLHTLKSKSPSVALGTYSNWGAYVHGGASQKVAKAITAAAKAQTKTTSGPNPCISDANRRVPC